MLRRLLVLLLCSFSMTACSGLVANLAAGALSGEGNAFRADDDPELVRDAVPFGLKAIESLLESSPSNPKLLAAAASGFTQYAYAYVLEDAAELEPVDPPRARIGYARARKLLRRAESYGFRGLEAEWGDGFHAAFSKDRSGTLAKLQDKQVVPLLYWTGAALAAEISLCKDDMAMVGRLPEVEALMGRALELDESFSDGAIHEFYVVYDGGRSETMGGSLKRAQEHLDRALALTHGKKIAPLVTWAEAVAVQQQDRKLFDRLLDQAIAFNVDEEPRFRLVNLIAQRRARFLKARTGDLFLEE